MWNCSPSIKSEMVAQSILYVAVSFLAFANAERRPWIMNRASSMFVEQAVSHRAPNVPSAEAVSIAGRIIDGAMEPPQATELVDAMSKSIMEHGTAMPPSAVLALAEQASAGYAQVRQSPGFSDYLKFVSENARNFNLQQMQQESSGMVPRLQQALQNLEQTAQGKEAVDIVKNLMHEIQQDAGLITTPVHRISKTTNPVPITNHRTSRVGEPTTSPEYHSREGPKTVTEYRTKIIEVTERGSKIEVATSKLEHENSKSARPTPKPSQKSLTVDEFTSSYEGPRPRESRE